jgi:hypothetical protein
MAAMAEVTAALVMPQLPGWDSPRLLSARQSSGYALGTDDRWYRGEHHRVGVRLRDGRWAVYLRRAMSTDEPQFYLHDWRSRWRSPGWWPAGPR